MDILGLLHANIETINKECGNAACPDGALQAAPLRGPSNSRTCRLTLASSPCSCRWPHVPRQPAAGPRARAAHPAARLEPGRHPAALAVDQARPPRRGNSGGERRGVRRCRPPGPRREHRDQGGGFLASPSWSPACSRWAQARHGCAPQQRDEGRQPNVHAGFLRGSGCLAGLRGKCGLSPGSSGRCHRVIRLPQTLGSRQAYREVRACQCQGDSAAARGADPGVPLGAGTRE